MSLGQAAPASSPRGRRDGPREQPHAHFGLGSRFSESGPVVSWDDLRLILLIGRSGSLSAAAQGLGINVSTCSRRLNQIEQELGTICFVRLPGGVETAAAGKLVLAHAEAMEVQASAIRREIAASRVAGEARVAIACPDSVAAALVYPALADCSDGRKSVILDVITGNETTDLHRGDAHIALRLRKPRQGGLRVRKIAVLRYGLYAGADYVKSAGAPESLDELSRHRLIGIRSDYPDHPLAMWWAEQCLQGDVIARTDNTLDRLACAAEGLGITVLPIAVGRRSGLAAVLPEQQLPNSDVYLLAHAGSLRIAEVRAVADRIAEFARQHAQELC